MNEFIIWTWFYGFLGLVVGSFLNVCIYRLPRGESIVFPGSHCPHCNRRIRPYDNVPVLSYLLLLGRCRSCRKAISLQYPAVELLTGLTFFACALWWRFSAPTFVNSLFLSAVIVLIFIDYEHRILPNVLTLPGIVAGVMLSPLQAESFFRDPVTYGLTSLFPWGSPEVLLPWIGSLFGALVGGGLLFLVARGYQLLRKRQGLGMGDVKMMAMVGAFAGWRLSLLTIFAGSLLGSLIGVFLIAFRGRNLQTRLAFGTLLGAGSAFALFFGLRFLHWYMNIP